MTTPATPTTHTAPNAPNVEAWFEELRPGDEIISWVYKGATYYACDHNHMGGVVIVRGIHESHSFYTVLTTTTDITFTTRCCYSIYRRQNALRNI